MACDKAASAADNYPVSITICQTHDGFCISEGKISSCGRMRINQENFQNQAGIVSTSSTQDSQQHYTQHLWAIWQAQRQAHVNENRVLSESRIVFLRVRSIYST